MSHSCKKLPVAVKKTLSFSVGRYTSYIVTFFTASLTNKTKTFKKDLTHVSLRYLDFFIVPEISYVDKEFGKVCGPTAQN
jgi:putative flippase GtrA